ncbi:hypothetical protein LIER_31540 [Lithospermum erythrorhizon]|uniref:Uncharacterized protein n=1 Tax=Lithospermum erythrorhizon TaxID=34254 RepID=A0AAV3RSA6_LITER
MVVETSSDPCRNNETQVVEVEAQNVKRQKNLLPLDTTQEMAPRQPTLYFPWVDVTNVRETENPRPDAEGCNADVGGNKPHSAIPTKGDSIGEAIPPIVEGRFDDPSHAEVGDAVERPSAEDLVETVTPIVKDIDVENAEGMELIGIPSTAGTDDLTVGHAEDDVTPSAADTGAKTADLPAERV